MQVIAPLFDFYKVASSLSLSLASYKPIPVVESSNDSDNPGRVSAVDSSGSSWSEKHPESEWGSPSILKMSNDSSDGRSAASNSNGSGKTVGQHGCTLLDDYTPKDSIHVQFPSFNRTRANIMRYRQQIGVNGGSWFVLESWMAPSMFSCASGGKSAELDFLKGYGTSSDAIQSARARLEKHWDTWIQEADFVNMRSAGINTLRLPIGYWNLPESNFTKNTPFEKYSDVYKNSWDYVRRAISYADKYDIGVLVDVHGAYGSQNGQAHSGLSDGKIQFFSQSNMDKTAKMVEWLVRELVNVTNVVGVELLNEPQNDSKLWDWYNSTINEVRKISDDAQALPLYFHDAFSPQQGYDFAAQRSDFVVQDTHSYFVYTQQDRDMSANQHTKQISGSLQGSMSSQAKKANGRVIVGEWSCALNPKSLSNSNNKKKDESDFCQAQIETYRNTTAGVLFWSWNMENCDQNSGWCFKKAWSDVMNKTYNAWGFNDKVTNKTIDAVSSEIGKTTLPDKYQTGTVSRQSNSCPSSQSSNTRRAATSASSSSSSSSSTMDSDTQGYADGFTSAKVLASRMELSRLGFVDQYIADSVNAYKNKLMTQPDSKTYSSSFQKGLSQIENLVREEAAKAL